MRHLSVLHLGESIRTAVASAKMYRNS